jgi:hypothetical protein
MDGAMYTKDESMGEMGLRRCIVMAGNDFAIEMDKMGCVWLCRQAIGWLKEEMMSNTVSITRTADIKIYIPC